MMSFKSQQVVILNYRLVTHNTKKTRPYLRIFTYYLEGIQEQQHCSVEILLTLTHSNRGIHSQFFASLCYAARVLDQNRQILSTRVYSIDDELQTLFSTPLICYSLRFPNHKTCFSFSLGGPQDLHQAWPFLCGWVETRPNRPK